MNHNGNFNSPDVGYSDNVSDQFVRLPNKTSSTSRACKGMGTSTTTKEHLSFGYNNSTGKNEKPAFNGVTDMTGSCTVTRKKKKTVYKKGWQSTKTTANVATKE